MYDLFLSHNWGAEQTIHKKVLLINEELIRNGFSTWFDEQCLGGNVQEQMAKGIDESKGMLCFITHQYMTKVNGKSGNDLDCCKMEFSYALRKLKPSKMLAVVLEPQMSDIDNWEGVLNMNLGGDLYVDMSGNLNDSLYLTAQVKEIKKQLAFKEITPSHTMAGDETGVESITTYIAELDVSGSLKEMDKRGFSYIEDLVKSNNVKQLSSLLNERTDIIKMRDKEERTPFLYAAGFGTVDCMKMFVKYGANLNDVTCDSYTALYLAVYHNKPENVQWLCENHAWMARVQESLLGYTPLHLAVRQGDIRLVKILLGHQVDLTIKDYYGRTALELARKHKKTECILELQK